MNKKKTLQWEMGKDIEILVVTNLWYNQFISSFLYSPMFI